MLTLEELAATIPNALKTADIDGWGDKITGKVRDSYKRGDQRALITTDRISAFDKVLGIIPYKGQVLNQLSLWWFEQTKDLIANHVIDSPDPNVTIARQAEALPVEVVVRGYITGVTSTSLWTLYEQGNREPYGIRLPEGLQKNDRLPAPVITPTTKAANGQHDERLTRDEIFTQKIIDPDLWQEIELAALRLYGRGRELAEKVGLILVDTKYEFGLIDGKLALIDEIHTPDSSRFWTADSYHPGTEPENVDKEFLRKWFAAQGYRGEGDPPKMPVAFIASVAARYMSTYERLTRSRFTPGQQPAADRIKRNMAAYAG